LNNNNNNNNNNEKKKKEEEAVHRQVLKLNFKQNRFTGVHSVCSSGDSPLCHCTLQ
jgi:hypothetical protein